MALKPNAASVSFGHPDRLRISGGVEQVFDTKIGRSTLHSEIHAIFLLCVKISIWAGAHPSLLYYALRRYIDSWIIIPSTKQGMEGALICQNDIIRVAFVMRICVSQFLRTTCKFLVV